MPSASGGRATCARATPRRSRTSARPATASSASSRVRRMGTRYEDQPVEHWAGPESLDPTPVWKQYLLVALLLVVGLVAVIAVSVAALAPYFATPPALVAGDRLVLSASDVPAVNGAPRLVSTPLIDASRAFYLVQPAKGEVL